MNIIDTVGDWDKWRKVMYAVGCAQQKVADACMSSNMTTEISLSQDMKIDIVTDSQGIPRQGIAALVDMGWQKRSSGNRYDSPSGVSLMIGALSKKIIQRHVCCKLCSVCTQVIP